MKYTSDPKQNWQRMIFDEKVLEGLSTRQRSEIETDRDLIKPIQQLVCDVHEEIHNSKGQSLENIASAQKRTVSLMARVAISNDRLTKKVINLTWAVAIMTLVITVFTILLYGKSK